MCRYAAHGTSGSIMRAAIQFIALGDDSHGTLGPFFRQTMIKISGVPGFSYRVWRRTRFSWRGNTALEKMRSHNPFIPYIPYIPYHTGPTRIKNDGG